MKKITYYTPSIVASGMPLFVFAADVSAPTDFASLVALIINLIQILIVVVFALTFLVFIWGIIKSWIIDGGEPESIKEGKNRIVVGVIVLVIMTTIWGILALLQNSFFGGG